MRYTVGAIIIFWVIIIFVLLPGCALQKASSINCTTETSIKRTCEAEGTSVEVTVLPEASGGIVE